MSLDFNFITEGKEKYWLVLVLIIKENHLHEDAFSLTILVQLNQLRPVIWKIDEENRTSNDFCSFVTHCYRSDIIVEGDILIMDNAPIHCSDESLRYIEEFEATTGIFIFFQPCYSPEINPCEFLFNPLKLFVKNDTSMEYTLME